MGISSLEDLHLYTLQLQGPSQGNSQISIAIQPGTSEDIIILTN